MFKITAAIRIYCIRFQKRGNSTIPPLFQEDFCKKGRKQESFFFYEIFEMFCKEWRKAALPWASEEGVEITSQLDKPSWIIVSSDQQSNSNQRLRRRDPNSNFLLIGQFSLTYLLSFKICSESLGKKCWSCKTCFCLRNAQHFCNKSHNVSATVTEQYKQYSMRNWARSIT